ncbi:MFS transporter [Spiribacter sp. 2438]|uniref:MFS transporter n=1 Tax=Spiribacter sp. 2438 TaxID=2666185 RepID=UPI0012B06DBE|nr:MFS transporter [Spiribacter sp. 2438]QGM22240.1 MFS transporter [Spiribacter sp. 2438]
MNTTERRATAGLAVIFGLRMLGLFLILPVFALYGDELTGATPALIGLAIGAYGLTQALLQIPFGMLSDRLGRRPVIVAGLLIFALGSVVAAQADTIYGVILGRILQGGGAIAAAVMALAADLTRDTQRTKAMALIGISVGAAFMVALVLGPAIAAGTGLAGVFWATAVFALVAMALLFLLVPAGGEATFRPEVNARAGGLPVVLRHPDLLRLDLGVLLLHLVLTASFVVLPVVLESRLGVLRTDHWMVYVPVLVLSVAGMAVILAVGERRRILHRLLAGVAALLIGAQLLMAGFTDSLIIVLGALWLFFVGFNTLEASLPSLLTRFSPEGFRGTALGVYSTAQFLGAFLGGTLGGLVYGGFGVQGVFLFCAAAAALWLLVALGLRAPVSTDDQSVSMEAS